MFGCQGDMVTDPQIPQESQTPSFLSMNQECDAARPLCGSGEDESWMRNNHSCLRARVNSTSLFRVPLGLRCEAAKRIGGFLEKFETLNSRLAEICSKFLMPSSSYIVT